MTDRARHRMGLMLLLGGLIAGCTPVVQPDRPEQVSPERVILYRDTVTVLMSDNTLCALERPGLGRSWSGTLTGCLHPVPVSVTLPAAMPPRRELQRGGALVLVAGEGWG